MGDHEQTSEITCPHCDCGQGDDLIEYKVATDKATGKKRTKIKCDRCGEDFFVQPVDMTVYNSWFGREEFYP